MKNSKQLFLLGSGIAGGFLAGYVVSAFQTSDRIDEQRQRVESFISRFSKVLRESQVKVRELNNRLKMELKEPIPDLYRATENLSLDESELIYD